MNGISPWAVAANHIFTDNTLPCIYTKNCGAFAFSIHCTTDSLWILVIWPKGDLIYFRAAYSPDGGLEVRNKRENDNGIKLFLNSVIGDITVNIQFPADAQITLRYTTTLKPRTDLLIPFWPRDIIIPGRDGKPDNTAGKIWVKQVGTRSGMVYFSITTGLNAVLLYLQNLTALNDYCQQTQTSAGETVGGEWPELDLQAALQLINRCRLIRKLSISDAIVIFDGEVPANESAMVEQYLNMLAQAYLQLPKPDTNYQDWPDALEKGA
jgi:hypothetical protein